MQQGIAKRAAKTEQSTELDQWLTSPPRKLLRVAVCGGLAAFALIGTSAWVPKLVFVGTAVLASGSWRMSKLRGSSVWSRWTVGFIDLAPQIAKFKRFDFIEIVYQPPTGIWELVLVGPLAIVLGWLLNLVAPGAAGSYQLWLNNVSDERVLVWQGNNQKEFESTLEILKRASGLSTKTR